MKKTILGFNLLFLIGCTAFLVANRPSRLFAEPNLPESAPKAVPLKRAEPKAETQPAWTLVKEKTYAKYKVQIFKRAVPGEALKVEDGQEFDFRQAKAVISNLDGKVEEEISAYDIEPDPRETVRHFNPETKLDFDGDGSEDLLLRAFSGGAHCCFRFYFYSLGNTLKKLGDLSLKDNETIELKDLNNDQKPEVLCFNPEFAYLQDFSFSTSPFPPQVYGLENGRFVVKDQSFPQVFEEDIEAQKKKLEEEADPTAIVQIVIDQLLIGKDKEAWAYFDEAFTSKRKELVKKDILERIRLYRKQRPATQPVSSF